MANVGGPRRRARSRRPCSCSASPAKYPWAHLDIAGTAWKGGAAKGATGRPGGPAAAVPAGAGAGGGRSRPRRGQRRRCRPAKAGPSARLNARAMTEIAFHFNVPDKLALRLPAAAQGRGAGPRVVVTGEPELLRAARHASCGPSRRSSSSPHCRAAPAPSRSVCAPRRWCWRRPPRDARTTRCWSTWAAASPRRLRALRAPDRDRVAATRTTGCRPRASAGSTTPTAATRSSATTSRWRPPDGRPARRRVRAHAHRSGALPARRRWRPARRALSQRRSSRSACCSASTWRSDRRLREDDRDRRPRADQRAGRRCCATPRGAWCARPSPQAVAEEIAGASTRRRAAAFERETAMQCAARQRAPRVRPRPFPMVRAWKLRYASRPLSECNGSQLITQPEVSHAIKLKLTAAVAIARTVRRRRGAGAGRQDRPRRARLSGAQAHLRQGQRERRAHGDRGPERQGRDDRRQEGQVRARRPKTTPPIRSRAPPSRRSCATPRSTAWSAT